MDEKGNPILYSFDGKQPDWHAHPKIDAFEFTINPSSSNIRRSFDSYPNGNIDSVEIKKHLDCATIKTTVAEGQYKGKVFIIDVPLEKNGDMHGLDLAG